MPSLLAPQRARPNHLPALDGVRLLAVGLVILHHITSGSQNSFFLHLIGVQRGNGLGPPLFFVLSGALLTTVINGLRDTENRYRTFMLRRVLRIFPLYFGYLLVAFVITFAVTGTPPRNLWAYALFSQNIFLQAAEQTGSKLEMYHLWTIAVQDQFYLLWPLLLWRCKTIRQMRMLCCAGIAVSILSRVLMVVLGLPTDLLIRSLPAVSACMCLGGLLALERSDRTWLSPFLLKAFVPLSILCGIWMWRGLDFTSPLGSLAGYQLVGLTCAAFITAAMHPVTLVARVLSSGVIASGGRKLAFGLYMWHPCLLDFCEHHLPFESKIVRMAIFLTVAILLADLSYRFYEKPFLRMKTGKPRQMPPGNPQTA